MAESESAESDQGPVDGETLVWYSAEVIVTNPGTGWANGAKVESSWKSLPHGWHFRVEVHPNGRAEHQGFVSAWVRIRPPAVMEGADWVFPDLQRVRFLIKGPRKFHSLHSSKAPPCPFSKSQSAFGPPRLVSHDAIRENIWLRGGKLRIVGEAAFLPVNFPCRDLQPEVFSKKPEFVTFLLTDGSSLHFDKRLVVERSLHFANMLSSEAWLESRTNVVDLRNNEQADVKSMQAVLCHFMSQRFRAACNDDHAFSVRKLADQFCLDDLVQEVESELVPRVCKDNLLKFLGRVLGSGGILEARCLEMLKANACEVLEKQGPLLDQVVDENPALAKFLMRVMLNALKTGRS